MLAIKKVDMIDVRSECRQCAHTRDGEEDEDDGGLNQRFQSRSEEKSRPEYSVKVQDGRLSS